MIDPGDQFCGSCGARLSSPISATPPSALTQLEAQPAMPPKKVGCIRRVLKFGCVTVIIIAVIAGIAAALGPQRTQTGQPSTAIENRSRTEATAPAAAAREDAPVQSQELLCTTELDPRSAEDSDAAVALDGRLGGTRESFEARFGPPSEEDKLFTTWHIEGCGDALVSFEEGLVTDVSLYPDDFSMEMTEGKWTLSEAGVIAARLLPTDVEMSEPYRNISTVEHHECFSESLATRVPAAVYSFVDNNPTQGQCSVVYSLGERDSVTNFIVQLQIEDPN
jgi:hypothetical protein